MKYLNKILYSFVFMIFGLALSCTEDSYLDETPYGFVTPETAFINKGGFESALANLYRLGRSLRTSEAYYQGDYAVTVIYGAGTDLGWYNEKRIYFGDYDLINSSTVIVGEYWNQLYSIIKDANLIISRLETSSLTDEEKQEIGAEAKFFRAYAYRFLVHLYGDVPLVTEEITSPKFDYVRAPKSEILKLMIEDLSFSSSHLPKTNPGNGRLSKAAADHVLAETYLSTGEFDKSIEASTRIIDDGQYELMNARFGTYSNQPGDVFWDLFRIGNQNRSAGNNESILVWQMEYGVPGGDNGKYVIERTWGPYIQFLKDDEGLNAILPADTLGRGVGFFTPGPLVETTLWESDYDNDIRNSSYNMQRVFYNNNPESKQFGQPIEPRPEWLNRNYHVWVKKASNPYGHPQGYDTSGRMFTDIYAIRLAETYLLRAEAYLAKSDLTNAAADINVVRTRAQASPVVPSDVNIDYVLDERARELLIEEPRRLTLSRLGLLYERVVKHNPVSEPTIKPFHNLFPIPQDVIDANTNAVLEQNPGYD
ncbi:RagB/SusD family nutrient uptake outer membrane protein [Cyclobacterium sp. 1_MG-2023]|uniref:RagB/SusD family nutrient uptake outer membrane protein n=1 Tax=Cyclobacterium sp. 1_MG-2023 TaxID=3062681 RepID=UPI0026E30C21|nr:RagB/SusD family nutrient uptake outer membrane protein [Cyclobacterium sp. 1_MG-2023]MDO6440403.1 RagB/SusD family nutrient uptake outer membrane protein [Cyclobacterium sp. 1_MG-2023]